MEFSLILPEILIALTLAFVLIGEITYHGEKMRLISATAVTGLAGAFLQTLIAYRYGSIRVFGGTLSIDGFSLFFELLFIALAALSIITSVHHQEIPEERWTEYCALILASCLAMCLAAASTDLLLSFISLQFINGMGYFLAGYGKRSILSTEAAVKYLLFGSVAGAMLLYGVAILFASTHSLDIYAIHAGLLSSPLSKQVTGVIFILVFLAFGFQLGAFPMYFWTPDVLEGAPTPASAFLSFGSRAVGFAVVTRFLIVVFAQPALAQGEWQILGSVDWTRIVAFVSGVTMVLGALLALRQDRAKRLVGYLVVAQTGYFLMGLLVLDQVGVAALLYNLIIELFTLIGIFYVLSFFQDELQSDRFADLKGLLGRAVPESICLMLFLVSLVGVPPMPGFIGKFTLIGAAIRHQWPFLAMLAIGSMSVSTVAVARLSYSLVGDFKKEVLHPFAPDPSRRLFLLGLMIPLALAGFFAQFVLEWAGKSLGFN